MNLLFYTPEMAPYGGIERHVCTLAATAARRGHRVSLLTTSNSLGAELRAELEHPRLELRELPAARHAAGKFGKIRWLTTEVLRARRVQWDVVYTNGQGALARLVWMAARGRARLVHHHHTAADGAEQATWSPAFRELLRRAPEVVACSCATRDALGTAVPECAALYLPYVTRCPVPAAAVHERPPGETLHFGFLGRLIPEKGVDAICRLSAEPALAGITWHIHGAGPKYPADYFARWPNVTFHGPFSGAEAHARALLALDAVVLFSTHNEGMPLSLIEAMSAGLPWVATDRGGTRELGLSPSNSLVVTYPADDAALAAAVAEMARRIRAGETSRLAQRRVYDRHFSPAVAGAHWLDFLEATRVPAVA
jgi:glycosyltransferase involved in cell wall biosynthesis